LALSQQEEHYVNLLYLLSKTRAARPRAVIKKMMTEARVQIQNSSTATGFFEFDSPTATAALLEFSRIKDFNLGTRHLKGALFEDWSELVLRGAAKFLSDAGYIKIGPQDEVERTAKDENWIRIDSPEDKKYLKEFHLFMHSVVRKRISDLASNKRHVLGSFLAVKNETYREAVQDLEAFHRTFVSQYAAKGNTAESVLYLATSLVPMSRPWKDDRQ